MHEGENLLEKLQLRLKEADNKANEVKISFENLCGMHILLLCQVRVPPSIFPTIYVLLINSVPF